MKNRYAGNCRTCGTRVKEGAGYVRNEGGRWTTYCTAHYPEQVVQARRELTADGRLFTPYDPAATVLIRSLPGARWNPAAKCWTVSLEPKDRARILEVCEQLKVAVSPQLLVKQELVDASQKEGLYPYQRDGVEFLALHKNAILGDEMGCGKTPTTLRALNSKTDAAIVICPNGLKYNWRNEFQRWNPSFAVRVLDTATIKAEGLPVPAIGEALIVNFESLPKSLMEGEVSYPHTTLIVDEAHRVKNSKAQVHKKVKTLGHGCVRTWFLTGTPLLNRPMDLWGLLSCGNMTYDTFGGGKWGWEKYLQLWHAYKGRFGLEWGSPDVEVAERLRRVMLRRLRKEVLPDLPTKQYQTLVTNGLGTKLEAKLDAIWAEFADQIESGDLPPFESFSEIRAELAESRIPAMLELISDYEESETPVVVFSAHKAPIEALSDREGWAVITGDTGSEERAEIVRQFQAGDLRGVGLTIKAGGVGLTLTRASVAVFVDLDWTPALNSQAEDRICRIGQKANKIQVVRMVSDHVLDRHVLTLLGKKISMIDAAIEAKAQLYVESDASETDEEYQQRLTAIFERVVTIVEQEQAEIAQSEARERITSILNRQRSRANRPEIALSAEVKEIIPQALAHMLARCDGAEEKDGMGFSKPDVYTSRWIAATGFDTEESYRAGERLLSRYYRQLHTHYPALFGK